MPDTNHPPKLSHICKEWQLVEADHRAVISGHQSKAPVKVSAISNELGLTMIVAPLPAKISGEIRPNDTNSFTIKINRFESRKRQRFTAAHELAHFLIHKDQIGSGIIDTVLFRSNRSNRIEAQANRLAADLLMPASLLSQYFANNQPNVANSSDMFDMAELFGVSEMALRFRLGV